jgi:hypothetical protein
MCGPLPGWLGLQTLMDALEGNGKQGSFSSSSGFSASSALSLSLKRPEAIRRQVGELLRAELKRDLDHCFTHQV